MRKIKELLVGGQPDDWLYKYNNLQWIYNKDITSQFPLLFILFVLYSRVYFFLSDHEFLKGGRVIFHYISKYYLKYNEVLYPLTLNDNVIYINITDARFFQVINEFTSSNSDTKILYSLLGDGDTFIDIGSNHGSFSIMASKIIGNNGIVHAFEPQKILHDAINKSLWENNYSHYYTYNVAVGNHNGYVDLFIPSGTSGTAGIFEEYSATHEHHNSLVPIVRFDDFFNFNNTNGNIVLKLDIEGNEFNFLKGANEFLRHFMPIIIMEINHNSLAASKTDSDLLINYLSNIGYRYFNTPDNEQKPSSLDNLHINMKKNIILKC